MSDSVHENLPAVPAAAVEEKIFDGEVVEERAAAAIPGVVAARAVVAHPAARTAARHLVYVVAGAIVLVRRWHMRRTRYERLMRGAEAAGNAELIVTLLEQQETGRQQRAKRRADTIRAVVDLVKVSPIIGIILLILMVLTGISLAVVRKHFADIAWPWLALFHTVALAVEVASVLWAIAGIAVPVGIVAGLWHLGRTAGDLAPAWSLSAKQLEEERGLMVTADTVVLALKHVSGIPELKSAFKDGWTPVFHQLPVKDGRGYSFIHSLPLGVTAGMIADRNAVLARNLHRAEAEAWPTDAERAGVGPAGYVAWWVADSGVLDKGAPEYPLMHEGTADVFQGVPGGVVARGDGATIPVVAKNLVLGGQMGMGKSNAGRVFMLGCALDPLCVLDVFVFANNGDFDAYAPRLHIYRKGVEDDTVAAAVERLNELYEEVARREGRLAELGAKKLTRAIAQAHPDMRPVVALFSECHELFGHPEFGELAGELAVKTVKRARKTGVVLVFDTQSSRKNAIPPALVELVSVNGCFYVKSWRSNDGFLGDGSFAAGIRATELRPERDVGRCVMTGISDAQFELLKWYYVEVDDDTGYDAAADVIARAVKNVAAGTAVQAGGPLLAIEQRDWLTDLGNAVKGDERVKLRDAVSLLRDYAKHWAPYKRLTAAQLEEDLGDEGVRVVNTSGTKWLETKSLREVLTAREVSE